MDHSRKFPTFSTSKSSVKNLWFWTWLRFKSRRLSMCRPSGRICSLSPWKTEIIGPLRCILFCWLWLIWMSTESALSLLHGPSKECPGAGRSKTHWPPVGILISLSATQPRQAWKCLCVKYSKVSKCKNTCSRERDVTSMCVWFRDHGRTIAANCASFTCFVVLICFLAPWIPALNQTGKIASFSDSLLLHGPKSTHCMLFYPWQTFSASFCSSHLMTVTLRFELRPQRLTPWRHHLWSVNIVYPT